MASQPGSGAIKLIAFHGSPRRSGNSSRLLERAVAGARQGGAAVAEIFLRDHALSPCLEDYGCRETGRCTIEDDFQSFFELLEGCDGVLLSSPLFFGTVSAQVKILIDRCQCFWVGKYRLGKGAGASGKRRLGLFICTAARPQRPDLFEGAQRTVRYFFDALDVRLWQSLLHSGLEEPDDVLAHPEWLEEAFALGEALVAALRAEIRPHF
ncbi:MAG: flavodoxin family protein [Deltaproteobacteria bacterium]|nr:flavodoxin family protein [Deltaproteobacteria bacterium]